MKTYRLLVVGLLLAASVSAVRADGIRVFKKDIGGAPVLEKDASDFMTQLMNNTLKRNRALIEEEVKKFVSKGDLIARGISLYNVNFRLGQPSFRYTSASTFEIMLRGNYLYARSTTPTALGKWADPAFEMHFDVRLTGTLSLPTSANPKFRAANTILSVPSITVKPRNVTGGVVTTAAAVANFFHTHATGRDLFRRAMDKHLRLDITGSMNAWLGLVNGPMERLHQQGYRTISTTLDQNGKNLLVTMERNNRTLGKRKLPSKSGPTDIIR